MWNWLSHPAVPAVAGVGVLSIVVYGGWQLLVALRPSTTKADTNVGDLAQNFEEMQLEGDISDEELRTIKAVLGKTQDRRPSK